MSLCCVSLWASNPICMCVLIKTANRQLIFFSNSGHINPSVLIKSSIFLLQNATSPNQLVLLLKCLNSDLIDKNLPSFSEKGGHFSVVLEQILNRITRKNFTTDEESVDLTQMWDNLLTLLR